MYSSVIIRFRPRASCRSNYSFKNIEFFKAPDTAQSVQDACDGKMKYLTQTQAILGVSRRVTTKRIVLKESQSAAVMSSDVLMASSVPHGPQVRTEP